MDGFRWVDLVVGFDGWVRQWDGLAAVGEWVGGTLFVGGAVFFCFIK